MAQRIQSFREFWPFYVEQHANALNRKLHFIGTSCVLVATAAALYTLHWWLFLLMPVSGYGFAWVGHFIVEKNRPATFTYPVWSLIADFVMYGKMWAGAMDAEVERVSGRKAAA
jgi:hypothetical protein